MSAQVLEGLNEAQRHAVETVEGPLLIIAGPGSGKTLVITRRIAYLVGDRGVSPDGILAVTFTNKAANEMRNRLFEVSPKDPVAPILLDPGLRKYLTISTFHSFCSSVLRRQGQHVGLNSGFTIYDDNDQMDLLKLAMEEADVNPKMIRRRAIQGIISKSKSRLWDAQTLALRQENYLEEVASRVYKHYEDLLARYNAVDFDDLLLKVVHLFQYNPSVLKHFQARYRYLLVDEFQDTNLCQYSLVKMLSEPYGNVCVVGDPDQSIYSWRNADIQYILDFQKDYPAAKVIALEENYRSTNTILDAAKELISTNRQRLRKDIWTRKEQGQPITVHEAFTEDDEAGYVMDQIEGLVRNEDVQKSDCAVLYRVNAQSRALEEACLRLGVSYRLVGGVRFYQRREIKDLIAYLRLINNPQDQISLMRVINTPPRGLGQRSLDKITRWAERNNLSLDLALAEVCHERSPEKLSSLSVMPRVARAITNFVTLIETLRDDSNRMGLVDLIDKLLEHIGYRGYLEDQADDYEDRWENVLELRNSAQEFESLGTTDSLTTLLEHLALVTDIDSYDENANAITLINLHQAKGLEFPIVFITGMEEGLLPHHRSMDNPDELEEERRLCYVGITRCMKKLYLTRAFRRGLMGSRGPTIPSRFLQEIPSRLVGSRRAADHNQESEASPTKPMAQQKSPLVLDVGDKVHHTIFGQGIVLSCATGTTGEEEATVAFKDGVGVKRLLLSYAPLEKISG